MSKQPIIAGTTDQTVDVYLVDSSTGLPLTGLAYNTSGLTCYYRIGATGTSTALSLATQTVGGAHSDGGFVEIDATNMPGHYRLDLTDAMVATAGMLKLHLRGAASLLDQPIEIQITEDNRVAAIVDAVLDEQVDDHTTAGSFGASLQPIYWADVQYTPQDSDGKDRWTVIWFQGAVRQTTITSPVISVYDATDDSALFTSEAMTDHGTGELIFTETDAADRLQDGTPYRVVVGATIGGAARQFERMVSRDG